MCQFRGSSCMRWGGFYKRTCSISLSPSPFFFVDSAPPLDRGRRPSEVPLRAGELWVALRSSDALMGSLLILLDDLSLSTLLSLCRRSCKKLDTGGRFCLRSSEPSRDN